MRILLLPSSFPPALGGIEMVSSRLVSELRSLGHEVAVVTNRCTDGDGGSESEVQYVDFRLPQRSFRSAARYLATSLRPAFVARSLPWKPDVSLVIGVSAQAQIAIFLNARNGIPIVTSTHGEVLYDRHAAFVRNPAFRAILRSLVRRSSHWIMPSVFLRDLMVNRLPLQSPIEVIPNGIDTETWTLLPPALSGPFVVGAWGRLSEEKGFDRLIEAFQFDAPGGAKLWIAGNGPERAHLEALCVPGGVELLGRLDPVAIHRLLERTHVVAAPSRQEAFGLSALEGAASGRAVLHDGCTGIGHVVGRRGLIVDFRPGQFWSSFDLNAVRECEGAQQLDAPLSWSAVASRYSEALASVLYND